MPIYVFVLMAATAIVFFSIGYTREYTHLKRRIRDLDTVKDQYRSELVASENRFSAFILQFRNTQPPAEVMKELSELRAKCSKLEVNEKNNGSRFAQLSCELQQVKSANESLKERLAQALKDKPLLIGQKVLTPSGTGRVEKLKNDIVSVALHASPLSVFGLVAPPGETVAFDRSLVSHIIE